MRPFARDGSIVCFTDTSGRVSVVDENQADVLLGVMNGKIEHIPIVFDTMALSREDGKVIVRDGRSLLKSGGR